MIILSFIFISFFHFVFIQAIKTSGLDWRISLLPMNTCLSRLVYNHLTLTGQTDSRRVETRSIVPECMRLKGNGTTSCVALKYITSARNQPHTLRYQDACVLIFEMSYNGILLRIKNMQWYEFFCNCTDVFICLVWVNQC